MDEFHYEYMQFTVSYVDYAWIWELVTLKFIYASNIMNVVFSDSYTLLISSKLYGDWAK